MNLWDCPSARVFMAKACTMVRSSAKHVCLILPNPFIWDFAEAFRSFAANHMGEVWQINVQTNQDPEQTFLCQGFEEEGRNLEQALETNAQSMYLLLVFDPRTAPSEIYRKFCTQLATLSKLYKDTSGTLLWRVIFVWPASIPWPRADVCLETLFWWGQIHPSDTEYAIERFAEELNGIINEWEYTWLYALCQGLASSDPLLAEYIFKSLPISFEQIKQLLQSHPLALLDRQSRQAVIDLDTQARRRLAQENPPEGNLRLLWSQGALDIYPNGIVKIHPAAFYAANRSVALEQLIVQGQIKVYLPLVQEVHAFLCRQLEHACGSDWTKKDENFANITEEIGKLPRYMYENLKGKYDPALLDLAHYWRIIRNNLAHSHMIDCETAIQAGKLYAELRDSLK